MKKDSTPPSPSRFTVVTALQEISLLLELQGGEPFRARAYATAARSLASSAADLDSLIKQDRLTEIKGVGRGLAALIKELYTTGRRLAGTTAR